MSWLRYEDAVFYGLAWALAAAVGLVRSLADDCFKSWRNSLVVGSLSGFLGAAIVAVHLGWTNGGELTLPWPYLGVSALIGAFSKQQIQLIEFTASLIPEALKRYVAKKLGFDKESSE